MEFTFDLSQTPVIGRRQRPASGSSQVPILPKVTNICNYKYL
jgi:hypothetical protein